MTDKRQPHSDEYLLEQNRNAELRNKVALARLSGQRADDVERLRRENRQLEAELERLSR